MAVMNFTGEEALFSNNLPGKVSLLFDTHDRGTVDCAYKEIDLSPYEGMLLEIGICGRTM